MRTTLVAIISIAAVVAPALAAEHEAKVVDRLDAAADVLRDMTHAQDKGIPQDLMNKAQCVVIIPGMKKAGFIVGGQFGRGFAVCRKASGHGWTAPAAIRSEGGSVGFQIGGSEQDVILLVMSGSGMKHLLSNKFTIGGDATAAAGPVGRDASAQTDAALHAEMLSYSRSRGLFAGISLQGATLRPDDDTNKDLYGRETTNREILAGSVTSPAAAGKLEAELNRFSARKG
ncbi:MAG TPA: lipid-binding SYLF domain-containing protein [Bryobacteraceae bacterium]|nr:lipid-binding SYLF domain-containing protein [Bryobacteraceae bacterium]